MAHDEDEYLYDPDYKDPKKDWLITAFILALAAVGVGVYIFLSGV